MRLLIAFYLLLGVLLLAPAVVSLAFYLLLGVLVLAPAVASLARFFIGTALCLAGQKTWPVPVFPAEIAFVAALVSLLPLGAAVGVWRRSQSARLILLAVSWWNFLAAPVGVFIALAELLRARPPESRPSDEDPLLTLAIAIGCVSFAAWQYWVLTSPRAKREFGVLGKT